MVHNSGRKEQTIMEKLLNGSYKFALEWAFRLLLLLVSALLTYNLSQLKEVTDLIHTLDTRVSVIESNRFTAADGLKLQKEILARPTRQEIQDMLNRLEDRLTGK